MSNKTGGTAANKGPEWIVVKAGTAVKSCRDQQCGKRMYFAVHPRTGRPHPVDCDVPGGMHPSAHAGEPLPSLFGESIVAQDGRGVSHFETCVAAAKFRAGVHD